jgi:hypothetical protein
MHFVNLVFCAATILLCSAIRKSEIGKFVAYFGFIAGIVDFIGAYPWLIGTAISFVTQLFFSAWFVILGIRILGSKSEEVVTKGSPSYNSI